MINIVFEMYKNLPTMVQGIVAYGLLLLIAFVDFLLGPEYSSSIFYLIPIALMTSNATLASSMLISFLAAILWLAADLNVGHSYSSYWVYLWNFSVRLAIFLLVSKLIFSGISKTKFYEALANKDELTGILNRRGFLDKANEELNRAKRFKRHFSLAFIDLDNFKFVNDNFGHKAGDELLKMISDEMRSHIRITDQVGRMGGDEFAILFAELDQDSAAKAFQKFHQSLAEKIAIQEWPVTISAGVITYTQTDMNLIQIINKADEWMYHVKKSGKNNVVYKYDTELIS